MNKKIFKTIYYTFVGLIAGIALLLIISVFPITGNYKLMIVQSGSMAPAIKMGGLVLVKPADEYKIGDVITFGSDARTKTPITHRIYDVRVIEGNISYITKGDANEEQDQREIQKRDILGKVLFSVPYIGYAVDFAKKPIGFMLIIIVPAVIIIGDEIKKIWKELKKFKNKKKDNQQDKEIKRLKQEISKLKNKKSKA